MTNRRAQLGSLPLAAALAIVLVIIGIAIFLYIMILGGGKEFANASDAGALNVAKVALRGIDPQGGASNAYVLLKDVAQANNDNADTFFQGQGDGPNKDQINLYNINKIWGTALLAGLNYEAMKAQGSATAASLSNAQKMITAATDLSGALRTALTDSQALKDAFTTYVTQNSTRMLNNTSQNATVINGWRVAYLDQGQGSDALLYSCQLPQGLPATAADGTPIPFAPNAANPSGPAIGAGVDGNGYVLGYKVITIDKTNNLSYCFTALPPRTKPHLVSSTSFNGSLQVGGAPANSPFVPNTFEVKAQMLVNATQKENVAPEMTQVASYSQAGPMDAGPRLAFSNAFIRISNFQPMFNGQTAGSAFTQVPGPANVVAGAFVPTGKVNMGFIPSKGFHAIEYLNHIFLSARFNGNDPDQNGQNDPISQAMEDKPQIIIDPSTGKPVYNTSGNFYAWGTKDGIASVLAADFPGTDPSKWTLPEPLPGTDTTGINGKSGYDSSKDLHWGLDSEHPALTVGLPSDPNKPGGIAPPPATSSGAPAKASNFHSRAKRRLAMAPPVHTGGGGSDTAQMTPGWQLNNSGAQESSGQSYDKIGAAKKLYKLLNSTKEVNTDQLTEQTTQGGANFDQVVYNWSEQNLGPVTGHNDAMPIGSPTHSHIMSNANYTSQHDCAINDPTLNFVAQNMNGGAGIDYGSATNPIYEFMFQPNNYNVFSGMAVVQPNRNQGSLAGAVTLSGGVYGASNSTGPFTNPILFATDGTIRELLYPESIDPNSGNSNTFATVMNAYTTYTDPNIATGTVSAPASPADMSSIPTLLHGTGSLTSPEQKPDNELYMLQGLRSRIVSALKQMDPVQFGAWKDTDVRDNLLNGSKNSAGLSNNPTIAMGHAIDIFLDTQHPDASGNCPLVCMSEDSIDKIKAANPAVAKEIAALSTGNITNYGITAKLDGKPFGEAIDANTTRSSNPFDPSLNSVAYLGPRYPHLDGEMNLSGDWGLRVPFSDAAVTGANTGSTALNNNQTGCASGSAACLAGRTIGTGGQADVRWWQMFMLAPATGATGCLGELSLREFYVQPDTAIGRGGNADTRSPSPCDLTVGSNNGTRPIDCPCSCFTDMTQIAQSPGKDKKAITASLLSDKGMKRVMRHAGINAQPHTGPPGKNGTAAQMCHPNCSHTGPC